MEGGGKNRLLAWTNMSFDGASRGELDLGFYYTADTRVASFHCAQTKKRKRNSMWVGGGGGGVGLGGVGGENLNYILSWTARGRNSRGG